MCFFTWTLHITNSLTYKTDPKYSKPHGFGRLALFVCTLQLQEYNQITLDANCWKWKDHTYCMEFTMIKVRHLTMIDLIEGTRDHTYWMGASLILPPSHIK